jgi:hypothetical protein
LAKRVAEIAAQEIQDERRALWRKHNSLGRTRPLVLVHLWGVMEEIVEPQLRCRDPFWRGHERTLRRMLLHDWTGDDTIIEPWITQGAKHIIPAGGRWGVNATHIKPAEKGGAYKLDPPSRSAAITSARGGRIRL